MRALHAARPSQLPSPAVSEALDSTRRRLANRPRQHAAPCPAQVSQRTRWPIGATGPLPLGRTRSTAFLDLHGRHPTLCLASSHQVGTRADCPARACAWGGGRFQAAPSIGWHGDGLQMLPQPPPINAVKSSSEIHKSSIHHAVAPLTLTPASGSWFSTAQGGHVTLSCTR